MVVVYDDHMTTDQLRRQFEKQIDKLKDVMLAHRTADKTDQWNALYYTHPSPKQTLTLARRVEAIQKVDATLREALRPIMVEVMQTVTDFNIAKEAEDKAKADRKARIAANKAEKAAIKKNPYHRLDEKVADILRQVAEPYRVAAVEMQTAILKDRLANLLKLAEQHGTFDTKVLFPYVKGDHWATMANSIQATESMRFLDYNHRHGTYKLKADTDAIIKAAAEQFAQDMVTAFIHKVGMKLSGIVNKKQGTHQIKIIGGSLKDYWMHFTFGDGAKFDVQSQVVWKRSINGVHFAQFPTCFRNVILSNGSKMELPSEAKMKEQFI